MKRPGAVKKYVFKTPPMKHQRTCFERSWELEYFAVLAEQGTGKTKIVVDTAAALYEAGRIDALIAVGPNEGDVPDNWIDQIAIHLPDRIQRTGIRLHAGPMNRHEKRMVDLIQAGTDGLDIITTNIEAIRTGSGIFNLLLKLSRKKRVLCVIDESTRIKSRGAAQTKGALKLGANANYRRIMTGLMTTQGPLDAFTQCEFLKPGLLGFDSFTAYRAHYTQMLPPEHGLVRYVAEKKFARVQDPGRRKELVDKVRAVIQLPARNAEGLPIYKNQDELAKKIAAFSFRVLKDDCLDLPPKTYNKRYVDLTPKQEEIYRQVKNELIAEFVHDGRVVTMTTQLKITRLLRLQQVVCNHYAPDPDPDADLKTPPQAIEPLTIIYKKGKAIVKTENTRLHALQGILDEASPDTRGIIWCRHHPEIAEVTRYLRAVYGDKAVVELHGKIKGEARIEARKRFQDRSTPVRWLVGQVRSGIGIDLYEGSLAVYYSNDYSLENRLQSEDREHRKGQTRKVTIYDIEARHTLDRKIIEILRSKKEVADVIMGDHPKDWI